MRRRRRVGFAPALGLGLALALGALATGCTETPHPAPAATSAAPEGPRTLRDLIDAPTAPPAETVLTIDEATTAEGDGFRTVLASYPSEGLRITGLLYLPDSPGPHPGVVVVHGSVDPAVFTTGGDLVREQETLARSGRIVFAPDLRGYAQSDPDPSDGTDAGVGLIADVVSAVRALATADLPTLDPDRIALLGHSRGGAQAIGAAVIAPDLVDAVVALSPVSTRTWWVEDHYVARDSPEFAAIVAVHGTYEDDPAHWDDLSPATFAGRMTAPLLILFGTADDPVYPVWQQHTVADWQAAGAAVELLELEGADHRLDPEWDAAWERIRSFLDDNQGL